MYRVSLKTILLGSLLASTSAYAAAYDSFVLEGNFLKISVNDAGTIGQEGTSPGILYDTTGTGTFDPRYDYLTPGTPWEGFNIALNGKSYNNNNSAIYSSQSGTLTNTSSGATQSALWTATYQDAGSNLFSLSHNLSFETDGKGIKIVTTVTAVQDLTGVKFARHLDPDVVTTFTANTRGTDTLAESNIVTAVNLTDGYVVSLYSNDPTTHNTGVSAGWTANPQFYLDGTDNGDGDFLIGLGFDLGDMLAGTTKSFTYYYMFGDDLADLDNVIGGGLLAGDILNTLPGGAVTVNGQTVTFTSDHNASQDIAVGTGGASFNTAGYNGTLSGTIVGGDITKTGVGRLIITGNAINSGSLTITGGSAAINTLFGGGVVVQGGTTLRGNGTVSGATTISGTLAPGNSPGTLTFTNDVTMLAGSTLQIDVDGTGTGAGAGNYSRVVVTGAGNSFTAAGTMTPVLRGITGSATNTFTADIGNVFNIVTAEGGVSGSFAALTQPAEGLATGTRFELFYGANDVNLAVTPVSYEAFAAANGTDNTAAAGAVVDTVRNGNAGVALRSGLTGLNRGQLAQSLSQLSGQVHADAMEAGVEARRAGRDGVYDHLAASRLQSKDGIDLWVEGIGNRSRIKADDNASGYRLNASGVAIGMDKTVADGLRLGLGFAVTDGEVTARKGLGEADTDSKQTFVYGSYIKDGYFLDAIMAYSWDKYRTDRAVLLNSGNATLKSVDKANSFALDAQAGAHLKFGKINVEPSVGFRWDEAARDALAETGNANVALSLAEVSDTVAQSTVGARASQVFTGESFVLVPEVRAYWAHDFNGIDALAARLQGVDFGIDSARPGRDAAILGAGLEAGFGVVRVYVNYDAELRSGATVHGLNGGLRVRF